MKTCTALPNAARHIASTMARKLSADTKGSPSGHPLTKGSENQGLVLQGDKVVYIPGFAPDLEHLESKYGRVGSINHYAEEPNSPGLIKLVIMNFND